MAGQLCPTGTTTDASLRHALVASDDAAKKFRYEFVRHAPDIVVYLHALRAELHMRMVMPAVLGSTEEVPYLGMARMETGGGGGPHWHGLSYGYKNPRVDVSSERLVQDAGPADADVQPPSLSTKEQVEDNDGGDDEESIESLDGEELIEEGGTVPDLGKGRRGEGAGAR